MKRVIQILLLLLVFMSVFVGALAWSAEPQDVKKAGLAFTAKDRQIIGDYYKRIIGNIAPGSLDRSTFSVSVEKDIARGGHLPRSVEKDLERLPKDLESQLSSPSNNYEYYRIGHHVILVRLIDLSIADVIKDVAWSKVE